MPPDTSKELTKRNASDALMPPPPAPKRIKRPNIVLDEDTYTSAISHIIRRDYFPGLAETDAQRDYLSALESKDNRWIREAGRKLTDVMTPVPGRGATRARNTRFDRASGNGGRTPSVWGGDTPRTEAGEKEDEDDEGLGKLDDVDLDMGLGAFQAKYTSEDQESFNQILDRANKKRFEKNTWLHEGNRFASKQRLAQQKVLEARKDATSNEPVVRPSQNLDDRPAAPNTHKHTAFNTLMFGPDGVESWAPTRAQAAESLSLAPPKKVLHHNTRLLPVEDAEPKRPPSPTISAIRDAVAGRPRLTASEGGYTGNETPRVNGYAFVDAVPPAPEDDDTPTDLLERFGPKGSTAPSFTMSESTPREKMHHKMVDRIASSKRTSSSACTDAPSVVGQGLGIFKGEAKTPRFLSAPTPAMRAQMQMQQGGMTTPGGKKMGNLTPAAQKLFEKVGGGTPRGGEVRGGFGEMKGSGGVRQWTTPTPKVKRRM